MAVDNPFNCLHDALKNYFNSTKFSDVVIRCEDDEFKAHKLILCAQSEWFSKACNGDWKEGRDGVIEIKEDDAYAIDAMLLFMYQLDYDAGGSDHARVSPMIFNAKVYSIADKYRVPTLKLQAKEKFAKTVATCWEMDGFPPAITEVYNSTPDNDRGLRGLVVETACKHIVALSKKQEFRSVLEKTSSFAADVTLLMAKGMGDEVSHIKTYKCPNCNNCGKAVFSSGISYY